MGNELKKKKEPVDAPEDTVPVKPRKKTVRLLLFGTGEGGKTTLLRQLKWEHAGGEAALAEEIASSRGDICFNVVEGAYLTVMATENMFHMNSIPDDLKAPVIRAYDKFFKMLGTDSSNINLNDKNLVDVIDALYQREDFHKSLTRRSQYQLHDGWIYQADKLTKNPVWPKWGGPRWEPVVQDLLHSRIRTMGMQYCDFSFEGVKYRVIDVGGQRSERDKFFRRFQKVDTVLFVASLSEYDQKLFEDESINRLRESLKCFSNCVNHDDFKDCWFVLIFNKLDIFKEKYLKERIPLPERLENIEYPYPPPKAENDDDDCSKAILWFSDVFKSMANDDKIHMIRHYTCTAIDRAEVLDTMELATSFLDEKYFG